MNQSINYTEKNMELFGEISKIDKAKRMVYGYATTDRIDSQGEIIDKSATDKAVTDYAKWRNIREMHRNSAVGIAPILRTDEKGVFLGAKVIDDVAWAKVEAGVYKGFSIGGKVLKTITEFNSEKNKDITRITEYLLNEISLVDRPSNPDCTFTGIEKMCLAKRQDTIEIPSEIETNINTEIEKEEINLDKTTEIIKTSDVVEVETIAKSEYSELEKADLVKSEKIVELEKQISSLTSEKEELNKKYSELQKEADIEIRVEKLFNKFIENKNLVEKTENKADLQKRELIKKSIGELANESGFLSSKPMNPSLGYENGGE